MKTKMFLLISFLILSLTASAQVSQQWINYYNGPANNEDVATSVVVDNSGNVYVAGYSAGIVNNQDIAVLKYNAAGAQLWSIRYNGVGNGQDQALKAVLDIAGNVYVTGFTFAGGISHDIITMKITSAGAIDWIQRYNGTSDNNDVGFDIKIDASSNVYVAGYSTNVTTGIDFTTLKYNSSGILQWVQKYNGPANNNDEARALCLDQNSNVYVTGYSRTGSTSGTDDFVTIKHNSNGIIQWIQRFNPYGTQDVPAAIAVDLSGNVVIAGYSLVSGQYDFTILKYNSIGTTLWMNAYDGTANGNDYLNALVLDVSGNIYVAGTTNDIGLGLTNITTLKFNPTGALQWTKKYNGPGDGKDTCTAITIDAGANVYITGASTGLGTNLDVTALKYNTSGTQQWVQRTNGFGNGNDLGKAVVVDNGNNVYIAGSIFSGFNLNDYVTIKYAPLTGIENLSGEIPSEYNLSQNYPNPFNNTSKLKFEIVNLGNVKIIVYDIMGRVVQTLVNERLQPGTYETSFDGSTLNSGVYFYRMQTGDFSETKRMTLIK